MNILIGLGNPGKEYTYTRHNAGWYVLEQIAQQKNDQPFQMEKKLFSEVNRSSELVLAKPQTFMNDSGKAVQSVLKWFDKKLPETKDGEPYYPSLFVVYDDLDLELGKYKIQFGSGPKIHNGLNSIRETLGSNQFWHVRIGVDGRQGDRKLPGHIYVLQRFTDEERKRFEETVKELLKDLQEKLLTS